MPVKSVFTLLFLVIEAILYILILAVPAAPLEVCCYLSILLCFLFALLLHRPGKKFFLAPLACTLVADYFLVVMNPRQQLWGMVFFLVAQTMYALALHRQKPIRWILFLRLGLTALAAILSFLILGQNVDLLAVVSICYYANLIINILAACSQWKTGKLLPIGFLLFLLCDTVIGLQVASQGYLPISEASWIYHIIFGKLNLAWFFYLPSQVLIVLSILPKLEFSLKFRKQ